MISADRYLGEIRAKNPVSKSKQYEYPEFDAEKIAKGIPLSSGIDKVFILNNICKNFGLKYDLVSGQITGLDNKSLDILSELLGLVQECHEAVNKSPNSQKLTELHNRLKCDIGDMLLVKEQVADQLASNLLLLVQHRGNNWFGGYTTRTKVLLDFLKNTLKKNSYECAKTIQQHSGNQQGSVLQSDPGKNHERPKATKNHDNDLILSDSDGVGQPHEPSVSIEQGKKPVSYPKNSTEARIVTYFQKLSELPTTNKLANDLQHALGSLSDRKCILDQLLKKAGLDESLGLLNPELNDFLSGNPVQTGLFSSVSDHKGNLAKLIDKIFLCRDYRLLSEFVEILGDKTTTMIIKYDSENKYNVVVINTLNVDGLNSFIKMGFTKVPSSEDQGECFEVFVKFEKRSIEPLLNKIVRKIPETQNDSKDIIELFKPFAFFKPFRENIANSIRDGKSKYLLEPELSTFVEDGDLNSIHMLVYKMNLFKDVDKFFSTHLENIDLTLRLDTEIGEKIEYYLLNQDTRKYMLHNKLLIRLNLNHASDLIYFEDNDFSWDTLQKKLVNMLHIKEKFDSIGNINASVIGQLNNIIENHYKGKDNSTIRHYIANQLLYKVFGDDYQSFRRVLSQEFDEFVYGGTVDTFSKLYHKSAFLAQVNVAKSIIKSILPEVIVDCSKANTDIGCIKLSTSSPDGVTNLLAALSLSPDQSDLFVVDSSDSTITLNSKSIAKLCDTLISGYIDSKRSSLKQRNLNKNGITNNYRYYDSGNSDGLDKLFEQLGKDYNRMSTLFECEEQYNAVREAHRKFYDSWFSSHRLPDDSIMLTTFAMTQIWVNLFEEPYAAPVHSKDQELLKNFGGVLFVRGNSFGRKINYSIVPKGYRVAIVETMPIPENFENIDCILFNNQLYIIKNDQVTQIDLGDNDVLQSKLSNNQDIKIDLKKLLDEEIQYLEQKGLSNTRVGSDKDTLELTALYPCVVNIGSMIINYGQIEVKTKMCIARNPENESEFDVQLLESNGEWIKSGYITSHLTEPTDLIKF